MRLPLLVTLVASMALASSADAQIDLDRYYPFHPGDSWTYTLESCSVSTPEACEAATVVQGYRHAEILRDTLVAGEPWVVAACTAYTAGAAPIGRSEYVLGRGGGLGRGLAVRIVDTLRDEGCDFPSARSIQNPQEGGSEEIQIGGLPYVVVGTYGTASGAPGQNGDFTSYSFRAAADIGPVREANSFQSSFPVSTYSRTQSMLTYAVVGGQTYGANPVASGEAPQPEFAVTASPSPAQGTTTVGIAGALGRPVRVEAFDVVGRRVWSGGARAAVRLDLSAWPAGLYVLRATHDGAVSTARLVVTR